MRVKVFIIHYLYVEAMTYVNIYYLLNKSIHNNQEINDNNKN